MYLFSLSLCQDEDEFPDLANGRGVQRNTKPESNSTQTHTQPQLPKNLVREGSEGTPPPPSPPSYQLICSQTSFFFTPLTEQLFVSMCITAGKPTRKLPYQHRADTHSYYHLCSKEGQEPEEESPGCSSGHCTGVF